MLCGDGDNDRPRHRLRDDLSGDLCTYLFAPAEVGPALRRRLRRQLRMHASRSLYPRLRRWLGHVKDNDDDSNNSGDTLDRPARLVWSAVFSAHYMVDPRTRRLTPACTRLLAGRWDRPPGPAPPPL